MTVRAFWPAGEAAQHDYELLRGAALAGTPSVGIAATRFQRRGLAGLIMWPSSEPFLSATVIGGCRPAWTPHHDPRLDSLAAAFELLLAAPLDTAAQIRKAHS